MKRELYVALLLCLLLVISFINISYINKLSSDLISLIEKTEILANNSQFDEAVNTLESAIEIWSKNNLYAGSLLRHSDADNIYDCFYDVKETLLVQEAKGIPALCSKLRYHINGIAKMEQIRLSSIL